MSYRVATRRYCLIFLKNRSTKVGRKQTGSTRFRFGRMFRRAPFLTREFLIQSASYPRSASNVFGAAIPSGAQDRDDCRAPQRPLGQRAPGDHRRLRPGGSCLSVRLANDQYVARGRDAGSVLVHAHDGRVYHLNRRFMSRGERIQDLIHQLAARTKRLKQVV